MQDVIFVVITLFLFGVLFLFVEGGERLRQGASDE